MTEAFNDHFSGHAAQYARHRPGYPRALYKHLATHSPQRGQAWDCATGNGQAAVALAEFFDRVVATDASAQQLAAAAPHPRVEYRRQSAEASGLEPASCDLVTVAQALHWFDIEAFYAEVRRVAKPGALVAAWSYDVVSVDETIDRLIDDFQKDTVGAYWPPERRLIDERYAGVDFPFARVPVPDLEMECRWTGEQALDYLATWSAVRRYVSDRGADPLALLAPALRSAWCAEVRRVRWPLTVLAGRVA